MSHETLPLLHRLLSPSLTIPSPNQDESATDREPSAALKRRASLTFEGMDDDSRKRFKECKPEQQLHIHEEQPIIISGKALADDLEQELQCGCCSGLLYRPVIVNPCQHYFCGSCCTLWVRNGGTNCPACRGVSKDVSVSRSLQIMVDVLLRADPSRGRSDREKRQADEVYRPGQTIRIPPPREASPEPSIPQNGEFARPCPHCLPGNRYGWRCSQPVPDPVADPDNAWHVDDGSPPGHGYCGNCENLLALQAPTTTKCDMCQVSFCGIGVQGRCIALPLMSQHPHGMSDMGDLIQSAEVYECFDGNTVEVDIMLDYMSTNRITPRFIYREIVEHIQSQPRKFAPLIELETFMDVHNVASGADPGIDSPRERICRLCATEVLLWGLKDWWVRERKKGFLDESVTSRRDCPEGSGCHLQKEHAHAKEFNHIICPQDSEPSSEVSMQNQPEMSSTAAEPTPIPTHPDGTSLGHRGFHSETQLDLSMNPPAGSEADVAAVLMDMSDDFPPIDPETLPPLAGEVTFRPSQDLRDAVDALI
ncbi:hypothetical protein EW146_g4694 [Bondarzewia mesenterica]|uniref:RING-type domain-containing protein n=1 Tax=Bondarzewia mesenterica TaxID=1095465 RepID=A0A4S4LVL2_9AGAM|nr:hypothetical protein EW146_g4694 [Bondarzewia mesenterica]